MGLRASKQGLEIAEQSRRRKGWTKYAQEWCDRALVGTTTLKRFWSTKDDIRVDTFQSICQALEVDWREIVDWEHSTTIRESLVRLPQNSQYLFPPFGDTGCIDSPHRFFNRQNELNQLFDSIKMGWSRSLVGESEIGKSSILSMICHYGPQRLSLSQKAFIKLDLQLFRSAEGFLREFCEHLQLKLDPNDDSLGIQLKRKLEGKRYVLCLDEIEVITEFPVYVVRLLRGLADGTNKALTLITTSRSPLSQLFPDSSDTTSSLAGICKPMNIGCFCETDARSFLRLRLQGTNIMFSESQIQALLLQSRGHPGRLQEKASELYYRLTQDRKFG